MLHKIYLSGGITGVKDFEELFQKEEDKLTQAGYDVVNPVKVLPPPVCGCRQWEESEHTWLCFMRYDIAVMMQECDKIALIPNWFASRGANVELALAQNLGFGIGTVKQWIERAQ